MRDFSADWLALRETADAVARDRGLAARFAAALPPQPAIVDLGAGTGAAARALAPLIGGDQDWRLVELDPALRAGQRQALLAWAWRGGLPAWEEVDAVVVARGGARWRFASVVLDLAAGWDALDALPADGVTASALLDLASSAWLARLAAWLAARRLPLYAALTVDGRRRWAPPADEDGAVAAAFRRHQGRDKGLGPAAGGHAQDDIAAQLAGHGFAVATAASDWRLGPDQGELLAALVAGEAAAARQAEPQAAAAIASWAARRTREAAGGTLALAIGHRDLLALPPQI